jgi:hypothetical protein
MESNQAQGSRDRVSRDTIYSQMSDIAMRHRNYEKESATFYTAVLSAILGFILSSKLELVCVNNSGTIRARI